MLSVVGHADFAGRKSKNLAEDVLEYLFQRIEEDDKMVLTPLAMLVALSLIPFESKAVRVKFA